MKRAKDDKTIQTTPKAVYEGGTINEECRKNKHSKAIGADAQRNGYINSNIPNDPYANNIADQTP